MSAPADAYAKISEKMKNEQFTEEEIRIVGKAKEQISSYATGGSIIGGLSGLALARARSFKGLQAFAIATGGFIIGSQLGLVMGAMASVKTIQSIPNFKRVMGIVQEVRDGSPEAGGPRTSGDPRGPQATLRHDHASMMPSAGHQRFPVQQRRSELMSDDAVAQQEHGFQGFKNGDGYHGGNDPNKSARLDNSSAWSHAQERAKELQNNSNNWSQIRQQNMPKSAWSDIREGRRPRRTRKDGDDAYSNDEDDGDDEDDAAEHDIRAKTTVGRSSDSSRPSLSGWDRVRQGDAVNGGFVAIGAAPDGPSDFARTREDLESRPSRQKNQYGDSM